MSPLSRRTYSIAAIVLAAIIFVSINIAASSLLTTARLDLTENGQFTLAKGSRNIISSLAEPITLKFFFSKKVAADYAQTTTYAKRVRDLLQQYASRAHGKIVLEEIDPEPFTPEEDEAGADGLTPAPTETGEQVYFGLVGTNRIDGKETIAYFAPEREPFLEYDLSSLIYRLETPRKPSIGIISGIPLDGGGMTAQLQGRSQQNAIYQQLSQTWSMQTLDPNFRDIPSEVGVLMIVHPNNLTDTQLFAIDQYVLRGGHAVVFVDPNSEISQASAGLGASEPSVPFSDLKPLFKAWGVAFDSAKVIADKLLAQRVQISSDPTNPVASYPIWLHATRDNFSAGDVVVANLQSINFASAGRLKAAADSTTTFTPLIRSSDEAALFDTNEVRANPHPQDLMSTIEPTGEKYTIAARISGPAKTAFPNGLPLDTSQSAAAAPPQVQSGAMLRQSRGPIDVIVMADTDIFQDRFWVRTANLFGKEIASPFADNGAFVLNSVENLTGSDDLISLRTRATSDRPFIVVRKLQADAQAQYQQEAEMLQQRLTDTQQRLHDLEQGGNGGAKGSGTAALSPQQQVAIERFRRQLVATREELRDVQHKLREEIDRLGNLLAFINIGLMPLLASLCALFVAAMRRRRRARAVRRLRAA